jgi:uncharacterized protein
MRTTRLVVLLMCGLIYSVLFVDTLSAQTKVDTKPSGIGYAAKKPVFGGACPTCPWGAIGIVVKKALKFYGWDVQICHYCAGGPRAARMVADAMKATPPSNPTPDSPPTPNGPLDFGATGTQFLKWAYEGSKEFAKDPQGPRKQLRLIATIQEPTYLIVAVKADSKITSLADIVEKRLPAKMMVKMSDRPAQHTTPMILEYFGITGQRVKSFGGTFELEYDRSHDSDVFIGWASLVNTPEYNFMYQASQKYDLRYLELPHDLRQKIATEWDFEEGEIPLGLYRGVNRWIPTVVRTGTAIYGRADMPDDFAYTLAKAMDEHKDLLQWSHMNFSYNDRNVWKAFNVPLHPGAARYYKERGYMK